MKIVPALWRRRLWNGVISLSLMAVLTGGAVIGVAAQQRPATPGATPGVAGGESASSPPTFAIYPKATGPRTYFDVTQKAGTSKRYTVVLVNGGTQEQGEFVGRTFAADVRVRVNGGLNTDGPNDEKTGTTTWLEYPNDEVTIQPGKGIERAFTVEVPKDTPPGQYVTALCFETADPLPIPGVPNLKQNLRQTIAFYLTVPGKIHPAFSIEHVHFRSDASWTGIEADIVNSGNIMIKPEGSMTISKPDGTPLFTAKIGFGAFYAGYTGTIQAGLGDLSLPGDFLVTIELRDPETGATAIVENQKLTTASHGPVEAEAPPVAFERADAELKPGPENPQFLNVEATITNDGDALEGAQLSLKVVRDGQLVETYVLVSPLSLSKGETEVSSRYIPVDGWVPGTWTFTLSIEAKDKTTGIAQVLGTVDLGQPVVIPDPESS